MAAHHQYPSRELQQELSPTLHAEWHNPFSTQTNLHHQTTAVEDDILNTHAPYKRIENVIVKTWKQAD